MTARPEFASRVDEALPAASADVQSVLLDVAIVLPTYNEGDNIRHIVSKLHQALAGLTWEAIFVDDDSPDGTAERIRAYACQDARIRLIHRVGRRGLSSACIEGMMATCAPYIAVMDADLQHDETILPAMLERLRQSKLDLVIGTRNSDGGSMGEFGAARVLLSRLGRKISASVCRCQLSDPMSGFFMLRRSYLLEVVRGVQGGGFKILVDLLSSTTRPVKLAEIGYTFRARRFGQSKLDLIVGVEYLFMIANRFLEGLIPAQMALYLLVGGVGLVVHLATMLALIRIWRVPFVETHIAATFIAMTENFLLNNVVTFRDRRLSGLRLVQGLCRFVLACSFGAWANIVFARAIWQSGAAWYLAGFAGIVLGSVWNMSISSMVTWRTRRRNGSPGEGSSAFAGDLEVYR